MKPFGILSILFLFCSGLTYAQTVTVRGKVFDNDLLPLPGAAVHVKDSEQGVVADNDGAFLIRVESGSVLVFSFVGHQQVEMPVTKEATLNIMLKRGESLNEVVLVGTRKLGRTALETPVPVDIIDMRELADHSPQINVNQILNYVSPSFISTPQHASDGTDHIDPISLRGLGPDQVLVLINGNGATLLPGQCKRYARSWKCRNGSEFHSCSSH